MTPELVISAAESAHSARPAIFPKASPAVQRELARLQWGLVFMSVLNFGRVMRPHTHSERLASNCYTPSEPFRSSPEVSQNVLVIESVAQSLLPPLWLPLAEPPHPPR